MQTRAVDRAEAVGVVAIGMAALAVPSQISGLPDLSHLAILVGGLLLMAFGAIELLRSRANKPDTSKSVTIGDITASAVAVGDGASASFNQALPPTIRFLASTPIGDGEGVYANQGHFQVTHTVAIETPSYPANELRVLVRNRDAYSIRPIGLDKMIVQWSGATWVEEGTPVVMIPSPRGRYEITIVTKTRTPTEVFLQLDGVEKLRLTPK